MALPSNKRMSALSTLFFIAAVVCMPAQADDGDVIEILEIDGEVLELDDLDDVSVQTESDTSANTNTGMAVPNMPEAALPDVFKFNTEEIVPTEQTPPTDGPDTVKVNVIEVTERYYLLEFDAASNAYLKSITQEANPGDLIEIEVTATNKSDESVKEVEMVNTLPTGPVEFLKDSVTLDSERGFYSISVTGETYFPPDTEIEAKDIRYIKWQIFSLGINDTLRLSYQIKIKE